MSFANGRGTCQSMLHCSQQLDRYSNLLLQAHKLKRLLHKTDDRMQLDLNSWNKILTLQDTLYLTTYNPYTGMYKEKRQSFPFQVIILALNNIATN